MQKLAPSLAEAPVTPRVLLVDDEPRNLEILAGYLAPLGYQLDRAGGGREALRMFERQRPDLILLDVRMPDLDGIDVLTHVRAQPPYTPVILVTGQTEREARLQGLEAGADEFLEKPVDRAILRARVQTLLRLKQAGDELGRRNERLVELQKSQRELTEFIVHDLNTPISVVHLSLEWIDKQLDPAAHDVHKALSDALAATAQLKKMTQELLDVASIEQEELPLMRERIDLADLFATVLRAHDREAQARGVKIELALPDGLGFEADRAILARVLDNLVANGLRHTPAGGKMKIAARRADGVEIAVSNTGRPIAHGDRAKLFTKFGRGRGAGAKPGATGLGLYFCKRAMEAHGGSIALRDAPPWAASFVLRLPP